MKAIILAAGAELKPREHGFLLSFKPKCLFHVNGVTILERIVSPLRKAGIEHIRVVVGFKAEQIEEYSKKNNLGLEFVYNREYMTDAVNSLLVGVKGIDDDVLILLGDITISQEIITQFINHKSPLVWAKYKGAYPKSKYKPLIGTQWCITKVVKEKLGIFKNARVYAEQFMIKSGWRRMSGFSTSLYGALFETLYQNGPVGEVLLQSEIRDIDFLRQTDEGKK